MSTPPGQLSRLQQLGCGVFALSLVFCSMEMVPGWGIFRLDWPSGVFYAIIAVAGAIGGALVPKFPSAGIPSGALAGVGALLAQGMLLEGAAVVSNYVMVLVGGLGMLPGVGLYFGLRALIPRSAFHTATQALRSEPAEPITLTRRRDEVEPHGEAEANPDYCPVCGGNAFRKEKSEVMLAVLSDRVCLACNTRYAPPTPRWAGLIYLACAVIAFVASVYGLARNTFDPVTGRLLMGQAFIGAIALAGIGVVCVWFGYRALFGKKEIRIIQRGDGDQPTEPQ